MPLESVLRDLRQFATLLDQQLLELVNKDYKDFVNLSANLVGIDSVIDGIAAPLRRALGELTTLQSVLADALRNVESKLDERRELARKRRLLELFAQLLVALERIETLLRVDQSTAVGGELDLRHLRLANDEATSTLIERVSSQFNQLRFFLHSAAGLPLVRVVEPRIALIERMLRDALETLFTDTLLRRQTTTTTTTTIKSAHNNSSSINNNSSSMVAADDDAILANCLRAYVAIEQCDVAEQLFARVVVRPRVAAIATSEALEAGLSLSLSLCVCVLCFLENCYIFVKNLFCCYLSLSLHHTHTLTRALYRCVTGEARGSSKGLACENFKTRIL